MAWQWVAGLGPNYACLFVGYVEERMLAEYTGRKPDYKIHGWEIVMIQLGSNDLTLLPFTCSLTYIRFWYALA